MFLKKSYKYPLMDPELGIVVGYDGSPGSMWALRWGALTAQKWAVPLTVCQVWWWPHKRQPGTTVPEKLSLGAAMRSLRQGAGHADGTAGHCHAQTLLLTGSPADELCTLTRKAHMVVVGSHGRRGWAGLPLGRVSTHLTAHADGPVIVLPPAARQACDSRAASVVVGTDGSPNSDPALGFGFAGADARRSPLHVVMSWAGLPSTFRRHRLADVATAQDGAESLLRSSLQRWQDRYPHVAVRASVTGQGPLVALLEAASAGELLVVSSYLGATEGGTDAGVVTRAILERASCPVAVVPRSEGEWQTPWQSAAA